MSPMSGGRRWRLVRARRDAVPASLRRFMRAGARLPRAARRRMGRAGPWVVTGVAVGLAVLVAWVLWSSTLLSVQQVRVTGVELLAPAQVRSAAAVADETPLLRVDRDGVAQRVGALTPVADVMVRRDWPGTLVIEVVERTAVAAVPDGDGFQLIDGDGVLFHPVPQVPVELPTLDLPDPGPADTATQAALTVLAALTPELAAELDTLTVTGPASVQLDLLSGHSVVWGDETDSEEKARVATALLDEQAGDQLSDGQVIDVSAPEVVVLR